MEASDERLNSTAFSTEKEDETPILDLQNSGHDFHPMTALEILRETVRILRHNSGGFMTIAALLICPVSAVVLLSSGMVNQSIVKNLAFRIMLVAKSSGLPLRHFIKHSCQKLSEVLVSFAICFPLFITLSLLSKSAVVYSVNCTYSRKKINSEEFYTFITRIWKRVMLTYLSVCVVISGCLTLFLVSLVVVSNVFLAMGFSPDSILYPDMVVGFVFSIVIANAVIICSVGVVVSVLENVSGLQALLRSRFLIKGQMQVGLLIFLGSTMGMAFVEGLFEYRVKTLSYGDGSSRIWEGPLLVVMYSFVVLIDSMMSAVFYFSCKAYRVENESVETELVLEGLNNDS